MTPSEDPHFERIRRWITLGIALFAVLGFLALFLGLWLNRLDPELTTLVRTNFPTIIGLPFAAIAAFIVVAVFRQNEAPLEFEVVGFKLKGAAGELVLWIACFLAIVASIRLLWKY